MKKILFLMPSLPGGGAEKVLIDILRRWDYTSFHVDLFLEYKSGVYLDEIPMQVNLFYLYKPTFFLRVFHKLLHVFNLYLWYREKFGLPRFGKMVGERYDTIISFMEGPALKYHASISNRTLNNITWIHIDLLKNHWSLHSFRDMEEERDCYKCMEQLIFVSNDAMAAFRKLYTIPGKHKVVYNLIDREQITGETSGVSVEKRKFTICSVGRLTSQKRYDRLIRVARRLADNGYDLDFWILGVGELKQELSRQITELQLENCVHLLGFVKPPHAYVRAADIFLATSYAEGYSLAVCEALCLGAAIVSTNVTGPAEILENSTYGLLTEEDDNSIYEALKKCIDTPEILQHYREMAVQRAKSFDPEQVMSQIYGLM